MNRVIERHQLSDDVVRLVVEAPDIAREHRPGQFIMLQVHEMGERIPLTLADSDSERGTVTLIFQIVGKTTHLLAQLSVGEDLLHLVGPLGTPTHIEHFGTVVCVGGGIGVAPLYPIARGMKEAGNRLITIMGARTQDLLILKGEMESLADELIVCTDDGSAGRKALVTEPLKELCEGSPAPDLCVAIGPPVMMKFCASTTKPYGVKTLVSLNTIMIDGTGMCGGCRVTVGGQTRFVCVDGPEFDGHQVDFDNMMRRLGGYREQEEAAFHTCRLHRQGSSNA